MNHGKLLGTLRKLPLCGKNTGRAYFEFPKNLEGLIDGIKIEQAADRALSKITCGVNEAISSIKLEFNDGVVSPTFGINRE